MLFEKSLLEIKHLQLNYGEKQVLYDINLTVKTGEIIGIAGRSGSGKSSLLKSIIPTLNPYASISGGKIFYNGMDLQKKNPKELRKICGAEIGYVFQDSKSFLCPIQTIEKQIYDTVLAHKRMKKKEIKENALKLLQLLQIDEGERVLKSYPFELSGGMNQRVGILMGMLLKPPLLLADEPTSSLDEASKKQVIDELNKMRNEFQTSVLLVTHDIKMIAGIADKIAVMDAGKILEFGPAGDVLSAPVHTFSKELLETIKQKD